MRLWLVGVLALTGCGGGGEDASAPASTVPSHTVRPVPQSDAEIAALIYSDRQRTPVGFELDPVPPGLGQVTTFHLGQCTDDWNEALDWSEIAAQQATSYSDLAATDSGARYFEFGRVPRSPANAYLRMRVYRCSYYDPALAMLNVRPLDAATVRAFAEYQWQFTPYNNFGNVVLEATAHTTATALEHTLDMAILVRAADPQACDRIDVIAWTWRVTLSTGEVEIGTERLYSFGARFRNAATELCGA